MPTKQAIASVILPVYNEERYLPRCIESLLAQSQPGMEVIVVDDGSTDRTVEIVLGFQKKNKDVILIQQEHAGPGVARNNAAKTARGKILLFLDADMYFDRDFVKRLLEPILAGKAEGTTGVWQQLGNPESLVARMRYAGIKRGREKMIAQGVRPQTKVFRAIDKQFFLSEGGFDTSSDYFDDSSISDKTGVLPLQVDAPGWHHNFAETLREVFADSSWGARSRIKFAGMYSAGSLYLLALLVFLLLQPALFSFFGALPLLIYFIALVLVGLKGVLEFKDVRALWLYPAFLLARFLGVCNGVLQHLLNPGKKGK